MVVCCLNFAICMNVSDFLQQDVKVASVVVEKVPESVQETKKQEPKQLPKVENEEVLWL